MKKVFQKFFMLGIFAVFQMFFLTTVNANMLGIGQGYNQLESPVSLGQAGSLVKCNLFDANGKYIGFYDTVDNGDGTISHHTESIDGSTIDVTLRADAGHVAFFPIDNQTASSFDDQDVRNNLNNPNAQMMIALTNVYADSDGVVSWNTAGRPNSTLKGVRYSVVRCVYLVVDGKIRKCLGCPFLHSR